MITAALSLDAHPSELMHSQNDWSCFIALLLHCIRNIASLHCNIASLHCCFIAFVILLHCIRNIASLHCCFIALVILLCNASLVYCHICFIALLHCWSHPLLNNNVSQNTIHFCSPPIAALYICILFYYARHRTKISNNKKKGPSRKQACLWLSWDYKKII